MPTKTPPEPLTLDSVIGTTKMLAPDLKKFLVKELGAYVYNEKVGILNITHLTGNFKGRTLKSIVDEFCSQEDKDKKREKVARESFESVATRLLSGEKLENALDFYAFLRANKLSPQAVPNGGGPLWVSRNKTPGGSSSGVCKYGMV